jgi:hypothetical protein
LYFSFLTDHLFNAHDRTCNRLSFHVVDPNLILSGAQDGKMALIVCLYGEHLFLDGIADVKLVIFYQISHAFNHTLTRGLHGPGRKFSIKNGPGRKFVGPGRFSPNNFFRLLIIYIFEYPKFPIYFSNFLKGQ